MNFKALIVLAILASFFCNINSQHITYNFNFNTKTQYTPLYQLDLLNAGTSVFINITSYPGQFSFDVSTLQMQLSTDTLFPTTVGCNGGCTQINCLFTCHIQMLNKYKISLIRPQTPTNNNPPNAIQPFRLIVSTFPTISSELFATPILNITDVFRDRITRLIFLQYPQPMHFSIYPAAQAGINQPNLGQTQLVLHPIQNIHLQNNFFDASGSNDILSDPILSTFFYQSSDRFLHYNTLVPLPKGYYLLSAINLNPISDIARITFTTGSYFCPFDIEFPDINLNFQGCKPPTNLKPGFPCIQFDSHNQICKRCSDSYTLFGGTCVFDTTCPPRHYFHFGECLKVEDSCLTFDHFTGSCLTCVDINMILDNGNCSFFDPLCGLRQYKQGNICFNVSQLCFDFDRSNGNCISCHPGFVLQGPTCVQEPIRCQTNQYLVNQTCRRIPQHCVIFSRALALCQKCELGFQPSGNECRPLICPPRTFFSLDFQSCQPVSQLCDTFDSLSGDCLTCLFSGYTVQNGNCSEYTSPLAGCQQRQRLGFGPCGNTVENCNLYNLITNNCDQCVTGWFKDYTGKCVIRNKQCGKDQISVQGLCIQRPLNCLEVNGFGFCVRCISQHFQIQHGQCIFIPTCPPGKFLIEGKCVFVTPGCQLFNPTTGQCLTCQWGKPAIQGLCCQDNQLALNGECVSRQFVSQIFLHQIMLKDSQPRCLIFHPTLKHCIQCNQPYTVDLSTMITCH